MFEGIEVKHKLWGTGTIVSIENGHISVDFQGMSKTLSFPDAVGTFLTVTDERLLTYAEEQKRVNEQQAEEKRNQQHAAAIAQIHTRGSADGDDSDYETPLLGKKSQDIVFSSQAEFYEVLGYLAKPGRIAYYQAEVTDDKEEQFKRLFPNQDYKVIKVNYGQSGAATKQGCQFRINLSTISGCPRKLLDHIGEKSGSWAGRINRSKFVLRLVQYNGFRFGHSQDYEMIKSKVPTQYLADFERGKNR